MRREKIHTVGSRRHRGMAMIYVVISVIVMLGFCSLAVDLGRVQTSKTELRRACDAAARAGVAGLSTSNSTAKTDAVNLANDNVVNNTNLSITNSSVSVGWWNTSTKKFSVNSTPMAAVAPSYPAVQVTVSQSIPLTFGSILGSASNTISVTSVAELAITSQTITVPATSNPWLAGAANGTKASMPDPGWPSSDHPYEYDIAGGSGSEASGAPQQVSSITLIPGATIQVSSVSGSASNDLNSSPSYDADGNSGGTTHIYTNDAASYPTGTDFDGYSPPSGVSTTPPGYTGVGNVNSATNAEGTEHGMSNIAAPLNSMLGVFLDGNVPDTEDSSEPPGLDFSTSSAQNYTTIDPLQRQPFFVGTGSTSGGTQQTIVVPQGATRFFLGTLDGHEWSNNQGSFTATVTQTSIVIVQ